MVSTGFLVSVSVSTKLALIPLLAIGHFLSAHQLRLINSTGDGLSALGL